MNLDSACGILLRKGFIIRAQIVRKDIDGDELIISLLPQDSSTFYCFIEVLELHCYECFELLLFS